jgi:NB-ARC domain
VKTLRASSEGLKKVDRARLKKGWARTISGAWFEDAKIARATLVRFWTPKHVRKETFINICAAVGITDWQEIVDWSAEPDPESESAVAVLNQDWGEAPDVSNFCGRTDELNQLKKWISENNCHLISVVGGEGVGKTKLTAVWADNVQAQFKSLVWRSLAESPTLDQLIKSLPPFLFQSIEAELPPEPIGQLVSVMSRSRCLLVLDQAEAIFDEGTGQYHDGYAEYGELLRQIGARRHSSCLMVISQVPLPNLVNLEQQTRFVRSLRLSHLSGAAVRELLQASGLSGETGWDALLEQYGGNPQVLLSIAATIREVFAGNVNTFLKECGTLVIPKPIEDALNRQLRRLSVSEIRVIRALATATKPLSFSQLQTQAAVSKADLPRILETLKGRSLIETLIEESADLHEVLFLVPLVLKKHIIRTGLHHSL